MIAVEFNVQFVAGLFVGWAVGCYIAQRWVAPALDCLERWNWRRKERNRRMDNRWFR